MSQCRLPPLFDHAGHLRWVNRGAAAIITAFGLAALLSLLA